MNPVLAESQFRDASQSICDFDCVSHGIVRHLTVVHRGWSQTLVVHPGVDLVAAGNQEGMSPVDMSPVGMRLMEMSREDMRQMRCWNTEVAEAEILERFLHRSLEVQSSVDHHNLQPMGEVEAASQEALVEGDSTDTADHSRPDSLCIRDIERDHPYRDQPASPEVQARVGRVAEVASAGLGSRHRVWLLQQLVDAQPHHHDGHLFRPSSWRIGQ